MNDMNDQARPGSARKAPAKTVAEYADIKQPSLPKDAPEGEVDYKAKYEELVQLCKDVEPQLSFNSRVFHNQPAGEAYRKILTITANNTGKIGRS